MRKDAATCTFLAISKTKLLWNLALVDPILDIPASLHSLAHWLLGSTHIPRALKGVVAEQQRKKGRY